VAYRSPAQMSPGIEALFGHFLPHAQTSAYWRLWPMRGLPPPWLCCEDQPPFPPRPGAWRLSILLKKGTLAAFGTLSATQIAPKRAILGFRARSTHRMVDCWPFLASTKLSFLSPECLRFPENATSTSSVPEQCVDHSWLHGRFPRGVLPPLPPIQRGHAGWPRVPSG
jgi:hypothetical protein